MDPWIISGNKVHRSGEAFGHLPALAAHVSSLPSKVNRRDQRGAVAVAVAVPAAAAAAAAQSPPPLHCLPGSGAPPDPARLKDEPRHEDDPGPGAGPRRSKRFTSAPSHLGHDRAPSHLRHDGAPSSPETPDCLCPQALGSLCRHTRNACTGGRWAPMFRLHMTYATGVLRECPSRLREACCVSAPQRMRGAALQCNQAH